MKAAAHPAKFSAPIMVELEQILAEECEANAKILDPFAGIGNIHRLPYFTVGVEIEPEWATQSVGNLVGDALALPFPTASFDVICTSPVYGNRMSDHHNARDDSKRNTYRHTLGRALHPNNSGQLQWGAAYRRFHAWAWDEAIRVLRPGGLFVLNISNHIRKGEVEPVTEWHQAWIEYRSHFQYEVQVNTRRQRQGENHQARVDYESILVFRNV